MAEKKSISGKAARSAFFVFFVGGLFTFLSICAAHIYNMFSTDQDAMPEMNNLEMAGVLAFGYIIYYGIRFGWKNSSIDVKAPLYDTFTETSNDCADLSEHYRENINKMSEEEKKLLKKRIADKCGFEEFDNEKFELTMKEKLGVK